MTYHDAYLVHTIRLTGGVENNRTEQRHASSINLALYSSWWRIHITLLFLEFIHSITPYVHSVLVFCLVYTLSKECVRALGDARVPLIVLGKISNKDKFPKNFRAYKTLCRGKFMNFYRGKLKIGMADIISNRL